MRRLIAAVVVAAGFVVGLALPAEAISSARLTVAQLALAEVGRTEAQSDQAGWDVLAGLYEKAGIQAGNATSIADLIAASTPVAPPALPVAGDFAVYTDAQTVTTPLGNAEHPRRAGIYADSSSLVLYDSATRTFEKHRYAELNVATNLKDGSPIAEVGTLQSYRLPAKVFPGGTDDTSLAPGRVELMDPGQAERDLVWTGAHPRDADYSMLHTEAPMIALAGLVVLVVLILTQPATVLIMLGVGIAGSVALGGRTFDGRGLHLFLTVLVAAGLVWLGIMAAPAVVLPVLGALALLGIARAAGVPVLGAIGGAVLRGLWNTLGFVVTVVTGVEDSDHSSLAAVFVAVACAPSFWLKPLLAVRGVGMTLDAAGLGILRDGVDRIAGLGAGVARPFLGAGGRLFRAADDLSETLLFRPIAIRDVAGFLRVGVHDEVTGATRTAGSAARALGWHLVDATSWLWRPGAIPNDIVCRLSGFATELDQSWHAGLRGYTLGRFHSRFLSLAPRMQENVFSAAMWTSRHVVPVINRFAELSRYHATATALTETMNSGRPGPQLVTFGSHPAQAAGGPAPVASPLAPPAPMHPARPGATPRGRHPMSTPTVRAMSSLPRQTDNGAPARAAMRVGRERCGTSRPRRSPSLRGLWKR